MFVKLKLVSEYDIGTAVSFNSDTEKWGLAINASSPFGIIEESAIIDDDGIWWAVVRFGGTSQALAGRDIPIEGGYLNIENGRVYATSADQNYCGLIAPASRGQDSRVPGDLILVFMR